MSSTQQSVGQSTQGTTMNESGENNESTEANTHFESSPVHDVERDAAAESIEEEFHDSGFLDDAGTAAYEYAGDKDFVLFNDDLDEDYVLKDDDAIDIASIKANYGSTYNGVNNWNESQIEKDKSCDDIGNEKASGKTVYVPVETTVRVGSEESGETLLSQHQHLTLVDVPIGCNSIQSWTGTFERHESIAYRFQQSPNPSWVFQQLQSWDEDIDLHDVGQPFH